jgi:tripartite-type tricarboxylate transporter receptor subunit TctC
MKIIHFFGLCLLTGLASLATAQTWPSKNLTIVVPYPAGGTSDVLARLLQKPLSEALGVTVVIENKTGAGGMLGAGSVAMNNDGHTVLLTDLGGLTTGILTIKDLPFKAEQLQGVGMLAYSPHLLAVHPGVTANNLKELAVYSQKTPLSLASAGSGSPNHLGVVDIALTSGLKFVHVPYRGGAQAITDTLAGVTHVLLNGMVATAPHIHGGKLKLIGVSSKARLASQPNWPTLAEQGVPGFESGTYQGFMTSASMARANVDKLNAVIAQVANQAEIKKRVNELGADLMLLSPKDTGEWLLSDRKRWANVIEKAGKNIESN